MPDRMYEHEGVKKYAPYVELNDSLKTMVAEEAQNPAVSVLFADTSAGVPAAADPTDDIPF